MKITMTRCRYTPKWETLERLIKEATNQPYGFLIGIRRRDNRSDYRKPGEYEVHFKREDGAVLTIDLIVEAI